MDVDHASIDAIDDELGIGNTLASPRRHDRRCFASEFDPSDVAIAKAWADIAPGVASFHLAQFEDGGACISLSVWDTEAPENVATWLIWPEAGQILARSIGPKSSVSSHRTVRSALQAITPISAVQSCGFGLTAQAMVCRGAPEFPQVSASSLEAAA